MKVKLKKEWYLKTKWGNVAMVSWGDRHLPGILMVHGYMDSAATFEPLAALLPDSYHYISFDFPGTTWANQFVILASAEGKLASPKRGAGHVEERLGVFEHQIALVHLHGHGKSDHVSSALLVPQGFVVEVIKEIVKHLQWRRFVCIAHSMGCLISLLYNHLYPGKMKKLISIDPLIAFKSFYYFNENQEIWFKWHYEYYYDHFFLYNSAPPRLFTRDQLIESTMAARHLTRNQAEVVLSRSMVPVENGLVRVSTQPLMRRLLTVPAYKDALIHILQHNIPPTLCIHATEWKINREEKEYIEKYFKTDKKTLHVYVQGHHDLHITHASDLVPHIVDFLDSKQVVAKL